MNEINVPERPPTYLTSKSSQLRQKNMRLTIESLQIPTSASNHRNTSFILPSASFYTRTQLAINQIDGALYVKLVVKTTVKLVIPPLKKSERKKEKAKQLNFFSSALHTHARANTHTLPPPTPPLPPPLPNAWHRRWRGHQQTATTWRLSKR